jgi:5'-nucleotidase
MKRRGFIRNVTAGATGLIAGLAPFTLQARSGSRRITILHTNDIHSHIEPFESSDERYNGKGGLARIAEYAKRVRAENPGTLLLDAGDMFQGTPYFNFYKGELICKTMSMAGYDAGTVGNHEFDNGLEGLKEPLQYAGFPLICSNYDFSDTILRGAFPRYKTFTREGIKIGIYGLGIELKGLVADANYGNTVYNDPLKTALEMESFLASEENCALIICLSHLGLRYRDAKICDEQIAAHTEQTHLIIGGHTHTYLEKPLEIKNKAGRPVIVNQAWWGGMMIGRIDFVFSENKKQTFGTQNITNS